MQNRLLSSKPFRVAAVGFLAGIAIAVCLWLYDLNTHGSYSQHFVTGGDKYALEELKSNCIAYSIASVLTLGISFLVFGNTTLRPSQSKSREAAGSARMPSLFYVAAGMLPLGVVFFTGGSIFLQADLAFDRVVAWKNMVQIGLGLSMYCEDNDDRLPNMTTFRHVHDAVYPYVKSEAVFANPHSSLTIQPNSKLSYVKLGSIPKDQVLLYDPVVDTRGEHVVIHANQVVNTINERQLERALAHK